MATGEGPLPSSQLQSKFSVQVDAGRDSNKSTPCGSPTRLAVDPLSGRAPVVKATSVTHTSRIPQISVNANTKEREKKVSSVRYSCLLHIVISTTKCRFTHTLKGDSRLAGSHLEIYVSLFQPATVVSKNFIKLPTVAGWNKDTYISR